mgnify:FL=1
MNKQAVKELMYGGLQELMHNKNFYYYSTVGHQYSHWTEEGLEALQDYMNIIGWKMLEAEDKELNVRAKDIVIKGLKGEQV